MNVSLSGLVERELEERFPRPRRPRSRSRRRTRLARVLGGVASDDAAPASNPGTAKVPVKAPSPPPDASDGCDASQSTAPTFSSTLDGGQITLASDDGGSATSEIFGKVSHQLFDGPSANAPLMIQEDDYWNRHGPSRDAGSVATASISQMTMSVASIAENTEEGDHYFAQFDSPARGAVQPARKDEAAATSAAEMERLCRENAQLKSFVDGAERSPRSVVPGVAPSGLASPSRHRKVWKSQATGPLERISSYEEFALGRVQTDDDATYETIADNYSETTGRQGVAEGIRRACGRLSQIHDFIMGNACWSRGVERVKEGINGCVDEVGSMKEDYGCAADGDSLIGEEDLADQDTALTHGRSIETSLFSQSDRAGDFFLCLD
ncbi:hypothetical protein ACHAXT_012458 [Thalassiosira profunda]